MTDKIKILVSMGTCGRAAGTEPIYNELIEQVKLQGAGDRYEVVEVGCMGLCHSEPTIELLGPKGDSIIYGNVKLTHAEPIVKNGFYGVSGVTPIKKNWYYPEKEDAREGEIQARIVLRNTGRINPELIEQYIENEGYKALQNVVKEMAPQAVIDLLKDSGLRGRGGGGFPTGLKLQLASNQKTDKKFVICNADEGDPGAFMDRAVLEGDPHAVLEAMAIAGYAIGADCGVIYIRAEYPLAVSRLETAIQQAKDNGFLGENLFGTNFSFNLRIKLGAGAFVCGEETALIHSIEGKRGEPTFKPPFPAESGLWGAPTVVNNVETYANIPTIMRKGAAWFKTIGTEKSPGTKVFALAGKINKVGLVEVPMGTLLKDIIYGVGEGICDGKEFKAVQTGGPSGGALKADRLETPIDYDYLKAAGSMMGSGGMIVMDEDDCMVNVSKFFLNFTLDESCGKCAPCRIGNKRLFEILDKITSGKGVMADLDKLENLAQVIKNTSLCGLGQTSPNPVLSTLKNFKDEYLAHVRDHSCPAGACKELVKFTINERCIGCTICAKNCPTNCISGKKRDVHFIKQSDCIKCGVCYTQCKFHAIDKG